MIKEHHHTHTHTIKDDDSDQNQNRIHHDLLYHNYLPAYLLATAADWLQGPYKYALYSSHGYTQRDIANLFVVGYGSGMILGSMVGGFADSHGRKKMCLVYCLSYTLSVLMKHCRHFYALMFGRLCGGIATSLLFSVFESWLIRAHAERGLLGAASANNDNNDDDENGKNSKKDEEKWLAKSFSVAMYGSSLVAIMSGIIANIVVENSGSMRPIHFFEQRFYFASDGKPLFYWGGFISAFDACLVPLVLCATFITMLWEENYGEAKSRPNEMVTELIPKKKDCKCNYNAGYTKKHSSIILEDDDSSHFFNNDENVPSAGCSDIKTPNGVAAFSLMHKEPKERMFGALLNASVTVWNTPEILICCIIGSLFESAMYIFIFLWTPALTSIQKELNPNASNDDMIGVEDDPHAEGNLPFGWIFASFMVCCMLGTIAFSHLSNAGVSASKCLVGVLALSSVSFIAMAVPSNSYLSSRCIGSTDEKSAAYTIQYAGMLLYEFCIGAYYPSMGTVKGTIVPEDQRAAIYNVFRFPMNGLVLVSLVWNLSYGLSFAILAFVMVVASVIGLRVAS